MIVYEDDLIIAFLDVNPICEGHTLVIPKEHYENVFEIPIVDGGGKVGCGVCPSCPGYGHPEYIVRVRGHNYFRQSMPTLRKKCRETVHVSSHSSTHEHTGFVVAVLDCGEEADLGEHPHVRLHF